MVALLREEDFIELREVKNGTKKLFPLILHFSVLREAIITYAFNDPSPAETCLWVKGQFFWVLETPRHVLSMAEEAAKRAEQRDVQGGFFDERCFNGEKPTAESSGAP